MARACITQANGRVNDKFSHGGARVLNDDECTRFNNKAIQLVVVWIFIAPFTQITKTNCAEACGSARYRCPITFYYGLRQAVVKPKRVFYEGIIMSWQLCLIDWCKDTTRQKDFIRLCLQRGVKLRFYSFFFIN